MAQDEGCEGDRDRDARDAHLVGMEAESGGVYSAAIQVRGRNVVGRQLQVRSWLQNVCWILGG
jgi:hypothetical protein